MDKELEALVLDNMDLADTVAVSVFKTATHALELDELKSIAYQGLVEAAARWRPYCAERDYSDKDTQYFKTFAQRRIRGAIYDDLRQKDWASRTLRSRSKQLREAGQESGATVPEMSAATGLTEDKVRSTIRDMGRRPISLDGSEFDVPGVERDVENTVFADRIMVAMVTEYRRLPDIQQLVVALKYHQGLSMREISTELNLPTAKVSQCHQLAVTQLHRAMFVVAEDSSET